MRNFNVRVEGTEFKLEVEEIKTVPLIILHKENRTWAENGKQKLMSSRDL